MNTENLRMSFLLFFPFFLLATAGMFFYLMDPAAIVKEKIPGAGMLLN
jgi:hypothetical protein